MGVKGIYPSDGYAIVDNYGSIPNVLTIVNGVEFYPLAIYKSYGDAMQAINKFGMRNYQIRGINIVPTSPEAPIPISGRVRPNTGVAVAIRHGNRGDEIIEYNILEGWDTPPVLLIFPNYGEAADLLYELMESGYEPGSLSIVDVDLV